jgi:mono/diheme cytochrome c family protein
MTTDTRRNAFIVTVVGVVLTLVCLFPGHGLAQDQVVLTNGQREYQNYCSVCHGNEGKRNGSLAEILKRQPADLTQLTKKNDGQYPFWRVYRTIDGRNEVMAHGSRTMPIWGTHFLIEEGGNPRDDNLVLGRILSLVYYPESIQQK